jgi:PAS domain S-box-containing protein
VACEQKDLGRGLLTAAPIHRTIASPQHRLNMNLEPSSKLSAQEIGERFDLLATDAREYGLFLIGLGGQIICWNPGAERLFGYLSHEIIGQHFSRFFTSEDVLTGAPEHELKTALADGRADNHCWQVRKDGSRFWCQTTVTPLLDEGKQARSFACVIHDLTENQALEDQRKRADGLAEANRNKEEFMALLSHELRSPLSTADEDG